MSPFDNEGGFPDISTETSHTHGLETEISDTQSVSLYRIRTRKHLHCGFTAEKGLFQVSLRGERGWPWCSHSRTHWSISSNLGLHNKWSCSVPSIIFNGCFHVCANELHCICILPRASAFCRYVIYLEIHSSARYRPTVVYSQKQNWNDINHNRQVSRQCRPADRYMYLQCKHSAYITGSYMYNS